MRPAQQLQNPDYVVTKELSTMFQRLRQLTLTICAFAALAALPASASAAPQPWWQVLTSSRPTNLWEPTDNVQEIETETKELFGSQIAAIELRIGGELVGCLGTANFFGEVFCENNTGFPPTETAAQLQALLEAGFHTSAVEVTGGPVGGSPFVVTVPKHAEPDIGVKPLENEAFGNLGSAKSKVLENGGSGRLVLTLTNLGDAPVDATQAPVTVVDYLPVGVEAAGVEAFAGAQGTAGPVTCAVKSPTEVSCVFEQILPSYEAIEVEILANLIGEPPIAGAPGTVTVSGANAPSLSVPQAIKVSPEPTPFGIEQFSSQAEEEHGAPTTRAGAHPFQLTTTIQLNTAALTGGNRRNAFIEQPGLPRNLRFSLPAGLVGNTTAAPQCPMAAFLTTSSQDLTNGCPDSSAVGVTSVTLIEPAIFGLLRVAVPVFNLAPAAGEPARFGFMAVGTPVVIDTAVDPDKGYRIIASVNNVTQVANFLSSTVSLWGTPGDPRHDSSRGWSCAYFLAQGTCNPGPSLSQRSFLRMPVQCAAPLDFGVELEPWNVPIGSTPDARSSEGAALNGCNQVPFDPSIGASMTSKLAENPSGLDFELTMPNSGLDNGDGIAEGQPKKVEVTLPEGVTINPSEAEGLVGCSEAEYARESAESRPGDGCPDASQIGTVDILTPLLEEEAHGALYIAAPHENPFGSLIALYMVARIPDRGIVVKQAGEVEADPHTGRLTTTFDDLPQLPFRAFNLHFRSGGRAPLVTPPACGTFPLTARFTPWSAADPNNPAPDEIVTRTSSFTIERSVDGGGCPTGGLPPFHPHLLAGTRNNAAGSYSPFDVRLTRSDGEQEFTNFSIKLPPGVAGKLAGIPLCTDTQIAQAASRTGPHGGQEELDHPSCPAASQVGRTLAGAGVGSILTYAPGKIYLAGPYHGAPVSMVSITSGVVGPFDIGTVVVRLAIRVNPETGEVFLDSTGSDPIPHIIKGIVLHLRDIRAYTDRPQFTFNPTSCEPTSTSATVLGSGADFASPADDNPFVSTSPFQAADCAALPFKPKLALTLKGSTKRAGNPALHAHLTMKGLGPSGTKEAGLAYTRVSLPKSLFLDNAHIGTVCTRVQFKEGATEGEKCPPGSVIGRAKAVTPILDRPLEGPIYLRSNPERELPDIAASLQGQEISVVAVGHTDSAKGGGLRNTFEVIPDAPINSVDIDLFGGKRGLIESSRNLCSYKPNATVEFHGHNGKRYEPTIPLRATGCKHKKSKRHSTRRGNR